MKNSKTANRYAKALLELSLEKGNLDAVNGNMQVLSDTINDSADLRSLIKNPTVKEEEKNTIFTEVSLNFLDFYVSSPDSSQNLLKT